MSTGNTTVGSSTTPFFYTKQWSGGDGRTENASGRTRTKWNNYSLILRYSFRTRSSQGNWLVDGYWPNPSGLWDANADLRLLAKLSDSVRGHSFNLGVALAEGHQTVSLAINTLKTLSLSIRDLKHGRLESAARRLGVSVSDKARKLRASDVSGRFLELRYGWLPLLKDVEESAKAYEALTKHQRSMIHSVREKVSGDAGVSASAPNWSVTGQYSRTVRIMFEQSEKLSAPRSLGLLDPLSVLWEVTPWSFVIDWFIPIGSYLDSLSIIPQLDGRFLKTTFDRVSQVGTGTTAYYAGGSFNYVAINMKREITSGLPVPLPTFKPLDKALSGGHIANAVALAHQVASGRKGRDAWRQYERWWKSLGSDRSYTE